MFTPTLRCECAQPASDRLMRKWCIDHSHIVLIIVDLNGLGHLPEFADQISVVIWYCGRNKIKK